MSADAAQEKKKDNLRTWNIWSILIAEILFIVLPLIVTGIVLFFQNRSHELLVTTEWSFATAILFGQALTKYVGGLVTGRIPFQWQRVVLFFAVLVVLGLVPSLTVLTIALSSGAETAGIVLTKKVIVAQLLLFIIGLGSYVIFGGVGELALSKAEEYGRKKTVIEPNNQP